MLPRTSTTTAVFRLRVHSTVQQQYNYGSYAIGRLPPKPSIPFISPHTQTSDALYLLPITSKLSLNRLSLQLTTGF